MSRWSSLTEHLAEGGKSVRLDWEELEQLTGALPASASRHRAWWSGDRPHVRAWKTAGFALNHLVLDEYVEFIRANSSPPPTTGRAAVELEGCASRKPQHADLLLVTCVKSKLAVPAAARDLYISPLFKKQRRYAEQRGLPWFILSAEHGLVVPEERIEPYELYLPATSPDYRRAWAGRVVGRLECLAGSLEDRTIEIHASQPYLDAIAGPLRELGAVVSAEQSSIAVDEDL